MTGFSKKLFSGFIESLNLHYTILPLSLVFIMCSVTVIDTACMPAFFYMSPGMFINLIGKESIVDESLTRLKKLYSAYKAAVEQWAPKCPALNKRIIRSMWRTRFCNQVRVFLEQAPPPAQCIHCVHVWPSMGSIWEPEARLQDKSKGVLQ